MRRGIQGTLPGGLRRSYAAKFGLALADRAGHLRAALDRFDTSAATRTAELPAAR